MRPHACRGAALPHQPSLTRTRMHAHAPPRSLYFKTLGWLRLLFIWLAIGSIPFLLLIMNSKFTRPELAGHLSPRDAAAAAGGDLSGGNYAAGSAARSGGGSGVYSAPLAPGADWDAPDAGVKAYPSVRRLLRCMCLTVGRCAAVRLHRRAVQSTGSYALHTTDFCPLLTRSHNTNRSWPSSRSRSRRCWRRPAPASAG